MLYPVRYKIKNRTKENPKTGDRVFNPNYTIEIVSGIWCSEKKKQIPLGEIDERYFRRIAGVITCGLTDPKGIIVEKISKDRYIALRTLLTASKEQSNKKQSNK